jgi:hypothetical protein
MYSPPAETFYSLYELKYRIITIFVNRKWRNITIFSTRFTIHVFSKSRKTSTLLRKFDIITDNGVMKGLTIDEIAEELGIPWKTAHKRIEKLGIKPLSYKALYDPAVVEAIRNVPGKGRPKKAAAPEAKTKPPTKSRAKKSEK